MHLRLSKRTASTRYDSRSISGFAQALDWLSTGNGTPLQSSHQQSRGTLCPTSWGAYSGGQRCWLRNKLIKHKGCIRRHGNDMADIGGRTWSGDVAELAVGLRHRATRVRQRPSVPSNEGALLRDWEACRAPVYFDFGDNEPSDALRFDKPILWRLSTHRANGRAYQSPVAKASFLQTYRTGRPFDQAFDEHTKIVERTVTYQLMMQASRSRPLTGFERYMARRQRARHRF
jgi:hypothetical protein